MTLICWGSAAFADEPAPEEVIIRGTPVGAWSSEVTANDAVREPADAAALVAELPSVHIRRLGAQGSFASISVRGSASSEVGAVLAGIPITSASDPAVDVAALPLWPGASYRVYRGFAPAALGTTGYLGGVLSIETPNAALGDRTSVWLSGGSFGSLAMRAGDARKIGSLTIAGGVYAARSSGDYHFEVPDERTGKLVDHLRRNATSEGAGVIERIEVERPWGTLGALVLADMKHAGLPGTVLAPADIASLETSRELLGVDSTLRVGGASSLRFAAWTRRDTSAVDDPRNELDLFGHATSSNRTVAGGGSVTFRARPLQHLSVALIGDGRAEQFVPRVSSGSVSLRAGRAAAGIGSDVEWQALEPLTLAFSGRVDARRDEVKTGAVSSDVAPSAHVGASLRLAPSATIAAHAGALERPPSFLELYGNGGSLLGDPSLLPERALSIDLGVRGDLAARHTRFSYEVAAFFSKPRDLITFLPYSRNAFHAVNIDSAELAGLEITATLTGSNVRTQLSYTLLSATNTTDGRLDGRPLPGRPSHDLAYDALYRYGALELRYSLDAIAGTTVDATGDIALPPRIFHGIGATVDLPWLEGLRAGLSIDNLFDLRVLSVKSPLLGSVRVPVSDFVGFPLPGRSAMLSLHYDH